MRPLLFIIFLFGTACGGVEAEAELVPPAEEVTGTVGLKAAVTATGGNVAADAGFIADGGSISIPTGFTASQCVMTVALASVGGSALTTRVAVNTTTGEVTCKSVVQDQEQVAAEEKGCTASYTVICAK